MPRICNVGGVRPLQFFMRTSSFKCRNNWKRHQRCFTKLSFPRRSCKYSYLGEAVCVLVTLEPYSCRKPYSSGRIVLYLSYLVGPSTGLLWKLLGTVLQPWGAVFWYMGTLFGCRNYRTRNQGAKPIVHPSEKLYQQLDKPEICSGL